MEKLHLLSCLLVAALLMAAASALSAPLLDFRFRSCAHPNSSEVLLAWLPSNRRAGPPAAELLVARGSGALQFRTPARLTRVRLSSGRASDGQWRKVSISLVGPLLKISVQSLAPEAAWWLNPRLTFIRPPADLLQPFLNTAGKLAPRDGQEGVTLNLYESTHSCLLSGDFARVPREQIERNCNKCGLTPMPPGEE